MTSSMSFLNHGADALRARERSSAITRSWFVWSADSTLSLAEVGAGDAGESLGRSGFGRNLESGGFLAQLAIKPAGMPLRYLAASSTPFCVSCQKPRLRDVDNFARF